MYNLVGVHLRSLQYGAGIKGSVTVDLSNLPNRIYILTITTDKGRFNEKVEIGDEIATPDIDIPRLPGSGILLPCYNGKLFYFFEMIVAGY